MMTKDQRINAVALHLPRLMGAVNAAMDALVGRGQHNIVLMVGAGDVVQYIANVPRENGVAMVQDLLARWQLGMPDTLPGETTPADTKAFEYLLNNLERAAQARDPAAAGYGDCRAEVLRYVGVALAKAKRGQP